MENQIYKSYSNVIKTMLNETPLIYKINDTDIKLYLNLLTEKLIGTKYFDLHFDDKHELRDKRLYELYCDNKIRDLTQNFFERLYTGDFSDITLSEYRTMIIMCDYFGAIPHPNVDLYHIITTNEDEIPTTQEMEIFVNYIYDNEIRDHNTSVYNKWDDIKLINGIFNGFTSRIREIISKINEYFVINDFEYSIAGSSLLYALKGLPYNDIDIFLNEDAMYPESNTDIVGLRLKFRKPIERIEYYNIATKICFKDGTIFDILTSDPEYYDFPVCRLQYVVGSRNYLIAEKDDIISLVNMKFEFLDCYSNNIQNYKSRVAKYLEKGFDITFNGKSVTLDQLSGSLNYTESIYKTQTNKNIKFRDIFNHTDIDRYYMESDMESNSKSLNNSRLTFSCNKNMLYKFFNTCEFEDNFTHFLNDLISFNDISYDNVEVEYNLDEFTLVSMIVKFM